jgi:hypothetical protein
VQEGVQIDGEPEDEGYGVTVMMTLPGDVQVMLYEPRHAMAITPSNTNAGWSGPRVDEVGDTKGPPNGA